MQRVICVRCFCYFLNREKNFGKNIVDSESYLMYYQDRKESGSRMKITVGRSNGYADQAGAIKGKDRADQ